MSTRQTAPTKRIGYVYQITRADGLDPENRYIGSTINFASRKKQHARDCKTKNYRVYEYIRENGGWDNFRMSLLESFEFESKLELTQREAFHAEDLKARLNARSPPKTPTICKHGKQGKRCAECGGSQICKHNKLKGRCAECGGSELCEHGKQKYQCRECCGPGICEHNKNKHACRECSGSSICAHGKRKNQCRECDPEKHAQRLAYKNEWARAKRAAAK